jgi:hypothetical protein
LVIGNLDSISAISMLIFIVQSDSGALLLTILSAVLNTTFQSFGVVWTVTGCFDQNSGGTRWRSHGNFF